MQGYKRNLGTIDLDTGELLEGNTVFCPRKRRTLFSSTGFMLLSQVAAEVLSNSDLDGVTMKVLWKLISKLDMENYIFISQTKIAEEMGLNQPHVSRSIKKLVAEGIILEGPKIGNSKTYRLDPLLGWKGSAENHAIALKEHVNKKMIVVMENPTPPPLLSIVQNSNIDDTEHLPKVRESKTGNTQVVSSRKRIPKTKKV
jgi:DNA-binding transcriptional ArsR family regulator